MLETIPIVLSLILIEGLLSVDNSLAIAAMASRPGRRTRRGEGPMLAKLQSAPDDDDDDDDDIDPP